MAGLGGNVAHIEKRGPFFFDDCRLGRYLSGPGVLPAF